MGLFKKLDTHADLMSRMADTVGADLGAALIDGRLDAQGLRSAVMSCTACDCEVACQHWLDQNAEGAAATPDYCRNGALLDRLRG